MKWEKKIPKTLRVQMSTMVIGALGIFLALQYNEIISGWFKAYFPLGKEGLVSQIIYLVSITIVIIMLTVVVEQNLDGK